VTSKPREGVAFVRLLVTSKPRKDFILETMNFVDLMALLPFYITTFAGASLGMDLRWLRCIRYFRLYQVPEVRARSNTAPLSSKGRMRNLEEGEIYFTKRGVLG